MVSAMHDVAWITCRDIPEPDLDEQLGLDALCRAGIDTQLLAWDDPAADPGDFRLCIPRSCWNYFEDPAGFDAFITRASERSQLLNGPAVLRWNLHKAYLGQLAARGVPVVPTEAVPAGTPCDVPALCLAHGWDAVVIKPAVSAGSFATRRFGSEDTDWSAAQAFLDGQLAERDMLVQEFVPSVQTEGERALVWIEGEFSHVVVKSPRFSGDEEHVELAPDVLEDERALGEAALQVARTVGGFGADELLYARIDTVEHHGVRMLGELELLEPSLFFLQEPAALERFVQAVRGRLATLA
jgi:hypothetical protein